MILDRNGKEIIWGDVVKNLDTNKTFRVTCEVEIVLNHSELIPENTKKIWKYEHLLNLSKISKKD